MRNFAALARSLNSRTINSQGVTITLSDGTTLTAEKVDDLRRISRIIPIDGLDPADDQPVVFIFPAEVYDAGIVVQQTVFTENGIQWRVQSLHATVNGSTCEEYPVVCHKK